MLAITNEKMQYIARSLYWVRVFKMGNTKCLDYRSCSQNGLELAYPAKWGCLSWWLRIFNSASANHWAKFEHNLIHCLSAAVMVLALDQAASGPRLSLWHPSMDPKSNTSPYRLQSTLLRHKLQPFGKWRCAGQSLPKVTSRITVTTAWKWHQVSQFETNKSPNHFNFHGMMTTLETASKPIQLLIQ